MPLYAVGGREGERAGADSAKAENALAKVSRDPRQVRRLLALAAVYDGMSRTEAAKVGGMDRQTLRGA